jgi:cytoskeletal protein RodZ
MSDHAVENNPRKELMFVGLFAVMLLSIIGLIFYGGYFRPAAPSVETLLAEAAANAEKAAAPIDASTATPTEMVNAAADNTGTAPAAVSPADAPLPTDQATAADPAASTNADVAPATEAAGTAAPNTATESRDVSTAAPVLGQ